MGSLEGTYDTKLHEAVRYGDIEETKIALHQGYDPNLIGVYQWSALHEAAHNGEIEILKLLLEKKGDPNRRDLLQGYTALHYAAREGYADCVQLLVDKGGRYDITDNNGNTSYDVATSECRIILDKQRVQDLMQLSPQDAKKKVLEESEIKHLEDKDKHFEDLDASLISESSIGSGTDESKTPALGFVHLTFEYHARKTTLRIRVWQISDLLLPPPNTSMINSIYVKSYLMPDKKKDSKRKTEEVKVESSEAHFKMSKTMEKGLSVQHVFSPSTFKFTKPLEYTDITTEAVKQKSVQVEVCVTQKYTKRSFLIGMYHLPLKVAIKKLVREKYPLIPCLNHTIPANMKVYCASELQITNSAKIFYSNPNIRNLSNSDLSDITGRAASDPDIQGIKITEKVDRSPVAFDIMNPDAREVTNSKMDSSVIIPGELENEQNLEKGKLDYDNIRIVDMSDSEEDVKVTKSAFKKVFPSKKSNMSEVSNLSKTSKHFDNHGVSINMDNAEEKLSPRYIEDWKYRDIKKKHKDEVSNTDSRPQTPTWDYYDMTPVVSVDIPLDNFSPSVPESQIPICLPMETTLGLHKHKKKSEKDKESKSHRKKKKHQASPGKAVPTIIITEDGDHKQKPPRLKRAFNDEIEQIISVRHDAITPSNIALSLDLENDKSEPDCLHTVQVIADVHVDSPKASSPDTSIHIEDSDSFIIDLENIDDFDDVSQSSNLSTFVDSERGVQNLATQAQRSRSELVSKHTIPMQVFIDESLYDSCDEVSECVDKLSPFKIPEIKEEEVSEV